MERKVLVLGALGQIGIDLTQRLIDDLSAEQVIASDIRAPNNDPGCTFEQIDVMDAEALHAAIQKHGITEIYHLAALLSATAEQRPKFGWDLNMQGLFNALELAKEGHIQKLFWPSSIAVFGPTTPSVDTPQYTIMEPTTVYGISKLAGERWCEYYHRRYGVDVRGVRYPGLISYKGQPGGGTTDYAVEIFHEAKKNNAYNCFLSEETRLPMMFMEDAIDATTGIMEADPDSVKIRSSYNIAGFSFTPSELAEEIKRVLPDFKLNCEPDFRQQIADTWPDSINDDNARKDWGWDPKTDLGTMVDIMLEKV